MALRIQRVLIHKSVAIRNVLVNSSTIVHACVRLLQRGMRVIVLPHTQVCTNKMNLSDEVDLEDYVSRTDKISAAEISAVCQEAGMHAVRKNR